MHSLAGRRAIITGANRGLGLEIARRFAAAGAHLALGARDVELLRAEIAPLKVRFPTLRIEEHALDVSSPGEVETFTRWATTEIGPIDVLVNNAGVYGPLGPIETVDWSEWAAALAINLNGSVLMARAVVPGMKALGRGAIIQVSGGGATNPLPGISAYAASKAAVVRFAETLALEVKPFGITVNAIAPGALNTRMLEEIIAAGPERVGAVFHERALQQQNSGGTPLAKGAEAAMFLASEAARGITGRLVSAVWDRYEDWPDHLEALDNSDLYTLRRITGRDRGQSWGDV
ncbi:MAG: family oxidoreductase [Xanthobacteraceae bacterium]|jgi:NAD(P)-dependent dehydrogenase (short-subunit alcohol dehydrogenase family)|nr:family oxidoreductase [Xanthobacteraceae bacterium]